MFKPEGRKGPIWDLNKNEAIQVKPPINEAEYDYCVDNNRAPLAKLTHFKKTERFDNKGIFGDLYDSKKESRFG